LLEYNERKEKEFEYTDSKHSITIKEEAYDI